MKCKAEGCQRNVYAKGLCLNHYQSEWRQQPMIKAIVEADSTCSVCQGRFPRLIPSAWVPSGRGIVCPTCSQSVMDPETDPRFRQFFEVVREEHDVSPIAYLNPDVEDDDELPPVSRVFPDITLDLDLTAAWKLLQEKLREDERPTQSGLDDVS